MARTGDLIRSPVEMLYSNPGKILLALFVTTIISYLDRYILALLASPLKEDLGFSDTQIGLLQGLAFTVLYAFASVPAGYLADRYSRKGIIVFGVLCWSLGTLCCGLASNFTEMFIARMVVGCGEATLGPAAISLISASFTASRRGRAISIYQLGGCVGGGASLLLGGVLLAIFRDANIVQVPFFGDTATWRLVFILFGLIGFIWAPVVLKISEPERISTPSIPTAAARKIGDKTIGYETISVIYAIYAAASFLNSGLVAWAPSMYVREFGKASSETGILIGLLTTVTVSIGCILSGIVGDRLSKRHAFAGRLRVTIYAFAIAAPGVFAFALAESFTLSAIGFGLCLFAGGLMLAGAPAVLADALPSHRQGLGMSVYFFNVAFFGLTLGPLSAGMINDTLYAGGGLRSAILWSYGAVALAGLALSLFAARPYERLLQDNSTPRSPTMA